MENNIVFRDGGFTVYRTTSYKGITYLAFKGEKLGEFRTINEAKRACKEESHRWQTLKIMLIGAGLSYIPLIIYKIIDFWRGWHHPDLCTQDFFQPRSLDTSKRVES